LNNTFKQRLVEFDPVINELNPIQKSIDIISKNKIFLLYEKIYGKVKLTSLQIFYPNLTLLCETQAKGIGNYLCHAIFDKNLVIAFKRSKKDIILQVYEIKDLRLIKDLPINYEIAKILLSEGKIYVISEKKPFINEYDIELNYKKSYGQKEKENKPYFVKDDVITIACNKIFTRHEDRIILLNLETGESIASFQIPDLRKSCVYVDFNKEKYLVYNGFNKLSYYNHKGELLTENKLRQNENFEIFQYSKSGHFAFINKAKNLCLIA
jgi:hypothetical protein